MADPTSSVHSPSDVASMPSVTPAAKRSDSNKGLDNTTAKSSTASQETFKSSTFWSNFLGEDSLPSRIYAKLSSFKKNTKYRISLIYTLSLNYFFPKKQPWYSDISDKAKDVSNIYLGAIPLNNKKHIAEFKKEKIKSILSLLEPFEYQKTFFSNPVTAEDWTNTGMKQCKIEALDFEPLSLDQINKAVKFLTKKIGKGKKVYVHCKAGKGRSVTAVCCYLIAEKNMSAKEAIAFVKGKRPNINLNKKQTERIEEFAEKQNSKKP
ncbi:MAG: hypothetical protein KR126chlam5_00571 [Candidatus Anoxychlamydiales bacterium]|nr:hypothetical protein [Candidatus Anoxychlamydiales bacterium]